jgi:epoxyqueuosine reductase
VKRLDNSLKSYIQRVAVETLGFDACAFTSPFLDKELDEYRDWVHANNFGDMQYLNRHLPFKENPNLLLDGVKSAIVVIKHYKNTSEKHLQGTKKVARYAAGLDYHQVMSEALLELERYIKLRVPNVGTYIGVDSRPIAERSLALKAGIGFRGRNTMVIRPKLGSYFLIGVMLTTCEFEQDLPFKGGCGTCTLCVQACPTGALSLDGKMNPTQCISYQTIEKKSPVPIDTLKTFQGWTFGCDICQEVCPFNHAKLPLSNWEAFSPDKGVGFSLNSLKDIPKNSALYRSRKRVIENIRSFD